MISDTMPALTVKVGDPVTVFERIGNNHRTVPCHVTKIGRLYIELTRDDSAGNPFTIPYRMLIDTQRVKSAYSNPDYFRTPAQLEWEKQLADINKRIAAHRITIDWPASDRPSPWNSPSRRAALADFLDGTITMSILRNIG